MTENDLKEIALNTARGILLLYNERDAAIENVQKRTDTIRLLEYQIEKMRKNGTGEPWHILKTDPERPEKGEVVHVHTGRVEYNQTYDGSFTKEVIAWQRWTPFIQEQ